MGDDRAVWTVRDVLAFAGPYLARAGADSPRLDAEVLLAHAIGVERIKLFLDPERPLTSDERSAYRALLQRRARHEPVAYLTGRREFWSLAFDVDPSVLIPRPESEFIVEEAGKEVRRLSEAGTERAGLMTIVDVGTGSGCLAIAVAAEIRRRYRAGGTRYLIVASDISGAALAVAARNARRLIPWATGPAAGAGAREDDEGGSGSAVRVSFLQADLLGALRAGGCGVDLIVANPPYVAESERRTLPRDVTDYEPPLALFAPGDGLALYERLVAQAGERVSGGGAVIVELDPRQIARARKIAAAAGFGEVSVRRDYAGHERVLTARRPARA
ncbi:MAG: peptide chain release factor N(5)-glutamine methyltransferase [Candidatus Schekmanbacteria bacterium]|nr:peptide chain release factor N(5)-glutamine methyltransferase [Candidatus Schekmanbacteria bacterium]